MGKTFKTRMQDKLNPTMAFISQPEPQETVTDPQAQEEVTAAGTLTAPPVRRLDEETKSRRLQLLLTPSLYKAVKARADRERLSVNELINAVLRDAIGK